MKTSTRSGRSLRRYVSLAAAGAMMMALMPAGQAAAAHAPSARDTGNVCEDSPQDHDSSFEDVGSGPHWLNIVCMADHGITEGLAPDGTHYGPRRDVTRGQMASFIVRFIEDYTGEDMPTGDPERFDDVPETDGEYVHATNIHKLAEADIVRGTAASEGDEYAPQRPVNRMQMGTFIRHALSWIDDRDARNESEPPAATHDWFPDPSAVEHEDNVDAIAEAGDPDGNSAIVEGFDDGTYGPTQSVLRDQMASYVMRAYDYAVAHDLGPEPPDPDDPGPTIDTASVTFDRADADDEFGTVSDGDTWELEFSEAMDTETEGLTFTIESMDTPGETFTVDCSTTTGTGNVEALCTFDADGMSLTIVLADDPETSEGTPFEYPVLIADTTLESDDGEPVDLPESETVLDTDAETGTGPRL